MVSPLLTEFLFQRSASSTEGARRSLGARPGRLPAVAGLLTCPLAPRD